MNQLQEQSDPIKVALYIRVSTDDQAEKYGVDLQKESLLNLLKSKGKLTNGKESLVLAGDKYIYIDDGISGTIPAEERPAFAKLKEDVVLAPGGKKPFDVVAVYKIDRFARKLKILLNIMDFFRENQIDFMSANESIDTSTPFGRAILGIIGVIAELEVETIKQRTSEGRKQAAKIGILGGTYAPYGYKKNSEKKLVEFKEESEIVKMIFSLFVNEKKTTYEIANYLRKLNIPTPESSATLHKKSSREARKKAPMNFWRCEPIRKILSNEIYIGRLYYNKTKNRKRLEKDEWKLSEFEVPSPIDKLTFEKAQQKLLSSKHENKQRSNHLYLLSGLLRCDACSDGKSKTSERTYWIGNRKRIKRGEDRFTYSYQCGGKNSSKHPEVCNVIPLPSNEIENYIINFCKKIISSPVATFNHQNKLKSVNAHLKQLREKENFIKDHINAIPKIKERIKEQHKNDLILMKELKEEFMKLEEREINLRKELREVGYEISKTSFSENYQKSLELFSSRYKDRLESIFSNRQSSYDIIHQLIEEIVVYSRPVKETDIIAGRKEKKDQQIPFRLHIKLKLPQDILLELFPEQGFGAENAPLSG